MEALSASSESTDGTILENLLEYCSSRNVDISPSIAIKRVRGRGLGIYAQSAIKKGDEVMHVPTSSLFTRQSIPDMFLDTKARKRLPVHGLLAAYLAFGSTDHLTDWMATWPPLTDFVDSMPLFWPEILSRGRQSNVPTTSLENDHTRKSKKPRLEASPANENVTSPSPYDSSFPPGITTGKIYDKQTRHFLSCLESVQEIFKLELCPPSSNFPVSDGLDYYKFLHMWSCVNTRCFYYLFPNQVPPEDNNEAMALCPGMDLFNHTDSSSAGCYTRCDPAGYFVVANRDHASGEELLLNYGNHSSDALWTEYGFLTKDNLDDCTRLDRFLLTKLSEEEQEELDYQGYLGNNYLQTDGTLCYRTEVAAWLKVLDRETWYKLLDGCDISSLGDDTIHTKLKSADTKDSTSHQSKQANIKDDENARQSSKTLERRMNATLTQWMHDLSELAHRQATRFSPESTTEPLLPTINLTDSTPELEAQARYHKTWQTLISKSPNPSNPSKYPTSEAEAASIPNKAINPNTQTNSTKSPAPSPSNENTNPTSNPPPEHADNGQFQARIQQQLKTRRDLLSMRWSMVGDMANKAIQLMEFDRLLQDN